MNLRTYQAEAVAAVIEQWKAVRSTLVVMPTGTGKTVLFSHVIHQTPGMILVVAHREELIFQAARSIEKITGEAVAIEMASMRADTSTLRHCRIVVASKDTLIAGSGERRRMHKWKPVAFSAIITDEAHHATAPTYRAIYDYFASAKLLGVTATPDRSDEIGLKQVFETVAYDYEIIDAVHDGWLVPVIQKSVLVKGLDYSEARTTAGDLNAADVSKILSREDTLHQFAAATIEIAGDKKTIVFAPPGFSKGDDPFRVSERLTEIINRHKPESARLVWQNTEKNDRRQILQDYKAGRFQFLVNVGVFTEGFDEPGIEVVSMVRPTKSRALYAQMLGRGTRPLPGIVDGLASVPARVRAIAQSAKPSVLVIDFVGNAGRHKLVTPADILGGKYDDRVLAKARKIAEKTGGSVMGAIEEAQTKVREEDDVAKQREEERRKHAKARAHYSDKIVDPFNVTDRDAPRNEQIWSRSGPATEKQINLLRKWGVDASRMNKVEASRAIGDRIQKFHARKAVQA